LLKILVVDDDKIRLLSIKNLLLNELQISDENIVTCINAQDAKRKMRGDFFNILILDVMLPQRDEAPSAEVGLNLLEEITRRKNIHTPGRIFGITANKNDIGDYREQFEKYFFTVVEAGAKNNLWKQKIVNSIMYAMSSNIEEASSDKSILCLTIHGIETRGQWQEDLKEVVRCHTNDISFESYKYGFYSFIAFFIPFFRYFSVLVFEKKFSNLMNKSENEDKTLIIFSHSFGTYIVVKGIERFLKKGNTLNLNRLILAGSVLKSNHDFTTIDSTGCSIVNETGDRDIPLLLSNLLVPYTGMAGRSGFFGFSNSKFVNRHFHGGHSHYFKSKTFIEKYWLPLFFEKEVEPLDQRVDNKWTQSTEAIVRHIGNLKEVIYFLIIIYLVKMYIW
jgi:CheY-like chemotaxis protein